MVFDIAKIKRHKIGPHSRESYQIASIIQVTCTLLSLLLPFCTVNMIFLPPPSVREALKLPFHGFQIERGADLSTWLVIMHLFSYRS